MPFPIVFTESRPSNLFTCITKKKENQNIKLSLLQKKEYLSRRNIAGLSALLQAAFLLFLRKGTVPSAKQPVLFPRPALSVLSLPAVGLLAAQGWRIREPPQLSGSSAAFRQLPKLPIVCSHTTVQHSPPSAFILQSWWECSWVSLSCLYKRNLTSSPANL